MEALKEPAVYIMANKRHGTLYTGVISNLPQRAQHREALVPGFTIRYGCKLLVYYEAHGSMYDAVTREKQIKAGSRQKKITLIEGMNPEWCDLFCRLALATRHCERSEAIQIFTRPTAWIASLRSQ